MTFLLDVNVLIALIDPMHVQHNAAHNWFSVQGHESWASCPMTENGVLRIVGHTSYPNSPGTPAAVALLLAGLRELPGHVFWPNDVSLLDSSKFDSSRLLTPGQVADSYLLGLARSQGGQLATLDRRLVTDAVQDGARHLHLIS
jgi:hypothetical protein